MIEGIDFFNLEAEKYWSFASNYKGDKETEIRNMIFSGDYLGAIKKNGHYFRFVKDGTMSLQGRSESVNGGYLNKISSVPQLRPFFESLPEGTVLLGEIYFPDRPGSKNITTIMGCLPEKAIDRQKKNGYVYYYIFDVWAYDGKSLLNTPFEDRISELLLISMNQSPYVEFAKYQSGEKLFDLLAYAREAGEEGIVITRKNSKPEPGKRTARKTLKIKEELDNPIDVFFTGNYKPATRLYTGKEIFMWPYWQDLKTNEKFDRCLYDDYFGGRPLEPITKGCYYGWAGSLEIGAFNKDTGEIVPIGFLSGLSDEIKEGIVNNPEKWVKRPMLVTAMKLDDKSGKLQHGKFLNFRDDIGWKDCTIDKIYG